MIGLFLPLGKGLENGAFDGVEPSPTMLDPTQLLSRLDALGIAHRTVVHPPVYTVEEAKAHRGDLPGHHIKNLFLRNRKEEMWLVVALEDLIVLEETLVVEVVLVELDFRLQLIVQAHH